MLILILPTQAYTDCNVGTLHELLTKLDIQERSDCLPHVQRISPYLFVVKEMGNELGEMCHHCIQRNIVFLKHDYVSHKDVDQSHQHNLCGVYGLHFVYNFAAACCCVFSKIIVFMAESIAVGMHCKEIRTML